MVGLGVAVMALLGVLSLCAAEVVLRWCDSERGER